METGNTHEGGCSFLKEPLSVSDLIGEGTRFEINTNFEDDTITSEMYDELNMGSGDEEEKVKPELLASPWTQPFAELRQQMTQINEHIYKKITHPGDNAGTVPVNARAHIRYNAYWEGEGMPFDSSYLRGTSYKFYTGRGEVLEGLESAVCTMHRGEQAQFLISYHLLFREMGCPPRIKAKADGLFIVDLVSFTLVGNLNADQEVPEEDRDKYALIVDKIKDIHLKGLDFFKQQQYKNAIRAFEKAVDRLNYCRLANEEEQKDQTAFLIKLCTNLAVCYNLVHQPGKTCIMVKEIRRLTNNKPSCKAIFLEGKALRLLGEFDRSRSLLSQAARLEPHNSEIQKEIKELEKSYKKYKTNEKNLWSRAMGVTPKPAKPVEKKTTVFEAGMIEIIKGFKENLNIEKLVLPSGLSKAELKTVDELAQSMEVRMSISQSKVPVATLYK